MSGGSEGKVYQGRAEVYEGGGSIAHPAQHEADHQALSGFFSFLSISTWNGDGASFVRCGC